MFKTIETGFNPEQNNNKGLNLEQAINEEQNLFKRFTGKTENIVKVMVLVTALTIGAGTIEKAQAGSRDENTKIEQQVDEEGKQVEVHKAEIKKTKIPGGEITESAFKGTVRGTAEQFENSVFTDSGQKELMKVLAERNNGNNFMAKRIYDITIKMLQIKFQSYSEGKINEEEFREILEKENNRFKEWGAQDDIYDIGNLLKK